MFDAHCHLQDKRIYPDLIGVIERARQSGVCAMLSCGTEEADWPAVAAIGSEYGQTVKCAFGVHPWYVGSVSGNWDFALEKYLSDNPTAAAGEIGLDYAIDNCDRERQEKIFIRQLDIAEALKRPVSIHCRKAWGALTAILKKRGGLPYGGAVHSYGGPPDLVKELENAGCYISFSAAILNKNAKRARKSLQTVSPQKLLAETDSPDMLPPQCEALFNEPSNLPMVIREIAGILGETAEKIATRTEENGRNLYLPYS